MTIRWSLAAVDGVMVGLGGWILLMPATRGHTSGVIFGTLLIGIAAGIGVLAATAESTRSKRAIG